MGVCASLASGFPLLSEGSACPMPPTFRPRGEALGLTPSLRGLQPLWSLGGHPASAGPLLSHTPLCYGWALAREEQPLLTAQ